MMVSMLGQLVVVFLVVMLVVVRGQHTEDSIQDLKDKLESLKTSKVTAEEGEDEIINFISIQQKRNNNSRDVNIQDILSKKCRTIRCQEEKNKRVVDFILKGDRNAREESAQKKHKSKLEELSAQLDKLIPTQKTPRRRLKEQFDREQPRSSASLGKLPQLRGSSTDLAALLAEGRNVFIFTLDGSKNPRFQFEK